MAVSISVTDVLKLFLDRGISRKSEVVEYLEAMAEDASEICYAWTAKYNQSLVQPKNDYPATQRQLINKLQYQFRTASTVLGGRLDSDRLNELYNALAQLLMTRDELKAAFEGNEPKKNEEILPLLDSLHSAAGVLRAIAANVKAIR
jgi:hypothetical protein